MATSDDVQGLVAQGRTVSETIEIARDVARRLFEAKMEREEPLSLPEVSDKFECKNQPLPEQSAFLRD